MLNNLHNCTCHKDLEQISSLLSVELIFDIFDIYYCSRYVHIVFHSFVLGNMWIVFCKVSL